MLRPLRIAITTGDADGVGPEVVAKALRKIGPQKNVQFFLWRKSLVPKRDLKRISKSFKLVTVRGWAEALNKIPSSPKEIVDINGNQNPAKWVEEAGTACFFKHLDGMATAPMSKPSVIAGGMADVGHTDILKRVSNTKNAYMTFLGKEFNVMLLTGHSSIKDVAARITHENILAGVQSASSFVKLLSLKKPMALLGLNPHAGDSGLIGNEEAEIILPALETLRKD